MEEEKYTYFVNGTESHINDESVDGYWKSYVGGELWCEGLYLNQECHGLWVWYGNDDNAQLIPHEEPNKKYHIIT